MNDMRPKFGPSPEAPASIEDVESHCYPVFVQPIMCPDNPRMVCGLDGWRVSPTGNWSDDFQTGSWFADDAVFWSRLMGPGFLKLVLCSLASKGGTKFGGLELGFLDRIARYANAGSAN
jgi:hypothetical protein